MGTEMIRSCLICALLLALLGCTKLEPAGKATPGRTNALSRQQAAELAAKLANARCLETYGGHIPPFQPNSYQITLVGSQWHWGKISSDSVGAFAAKVVFDKYGADPNVEVAMYTDGVPVRTIIDKEIIIDQGTGNWTVPEKLEE